MTAASIADVPPFEAFMWPIVERLRAHGRSMTVAEMFDDVPGSMGLSDEVRNVRHGKWNENAVSQRLGFARSFLKLGGALENSARGVWSLTPLGAGLSEDQVARLPRQVQRDYAKRKTREQAADASSGPESAPAVEEEAAGNWKDQLLSVLQKLDPSAFERLCQRVLREYDFIKVEVTGKSGDGGIDGTGVLRVNLLSFHVLFQCKRYSGSVGAGAVRDFRGAMVGRTDKGLIITTGTFTADARRGATRDGAPAIDLVDGDALCDLLKDRGLGVTVRMVEEITVNEAAFANF